METVKLIGAIVAAIATTVGAIKGIIEIIKQLRERQNDADSLKEDTSRVEPNAVSAEEHTKATDELEVTLPSLSIPHNLPPRNPFVGREEEIARVHEALRSRSYLISIEGIGGIGKTSLALEVAFECLAASRQHNPKAKAAIFSGFIWATAKDRDLRLEDILDIIADTIGYPGIVQQSLGQKLSSIRRLLQEKVYLLIIDNFETIVDNEIRNFLLNLPEPTKALITSREQKLQRVWSISLHGLEDEEALTLIRERGRALGLESLENGDEETLLQLVRGTGGAPLAIKWSVGQIKQKGQSLDTVLTALHAARGDIFDDIFARSWSTLTASAKQVLSVMPIFPSSTSCSALEFASDIHHFVLDEALGTLVQMCLVDATDELDETKRRYGIHPLTRFFVLRNLRHQPEFEHKTRCRIINYYEEFVKVNGGLWNWAGFEQLELDFINILQAIRWCRSVNQVDTGFDMLDNLVGFLLIKGNWNDVLTSKQSSDSTTPLPVEKYPVDQFLFHQIQAEGHALSVEDKDLCIQAYQIAKQAHQNRTRYSGDLYIYHGLAVALIVISVMGKKDLAKIAAALNHDVIGATSAEKILSQIESKLGTM